MHCKSLIRSHLTVATFMVATTIAHSFAQTNHLAPREIAAGPFQQSWESLEQYKCPEWILDAKFGIWAHWTAQCVPEQGDWYARYMYMQGTPDYNYHLVHYGHPSQFGFKDIDHLWKAEKWDPEKLMDLYQRAGAKFFYALGNHHDNFDCWDSTYQEWNSVRVGPKKDIVGMWANAARAHGMRFGASVHASHAFRWFAVAHGCDTNGPFAGVPYDGNLTKADGKGTWWEGLDPQELYGKPMVPIPKDAGAWSLKGADQKYVTKFFDRTKELIDKYKLDLLMFDDDDLPFGEVGLSLAAHLYNSSMQWHDGRNEAVLNTRISQPQHMNAVMHMYERGFAEKLESNPWEAATCIGDWHYKRGITYKTAQQVIRLLVDVISKNGILVLNVPLKGDGSIDDSELKFLRDMAAWIEVNGEAIYSTRPWIVYGEGPTRFKGGQFNDRIVNKFTAADIRFTTKEGVLYAIAMDWPGEQLLIRALAKGSPLVTGTAEEVRLLGCNTPLAFTRDEEGLKIALPARKPCDHAFAFKISGFKTNASADLDAWESLNRVIRPNTVDTLTMDAGRAEMHGKHIQLESVEDNLFVGHWSDPQDWVSWRAEFKQAGSYEILVRAAAESATEFVVEVEGHEVEGKIPVTSGKDRFQSMSLGRIQVGKPGLVEIKLRPKDALYWRAVDLGQLQLTKVHP
jgi:alpha-L-fucosidase